MLITNDRDAVHPATSDGPYGGELDQLRASDGGSSSPSAPTSADFTALLLSDGSVCALVGNEVLAREAVELARRPGPLRQAAVQDVHALTARVVGRDAAS